MKKVLFSLAAAIFAIGTFASTASAIELKVGTGGEKGNYYGMANDINNYCGDTLFDGDGNPVTLDIQISGGSIDNLNGMGNKKYSVGIVQQDVLQYMAKKDANRVNNNRIKVIAGMHSETIHLLIPKGYQPKNNDEGGLFGNFMSAIGFGDDGPVAIDVNLLKNQQVGAWGGSIVSAEAMSYFLELNLDVVEVDRDNPTAKGLPLIIVGGQPYKPVEEILSKGKYIMVGINHGLLAAKAPFYMPSTANYSVDGRLQAIPTVGVRALMVGKSFRKDSLNAPMSSLAQCVSDNLADLADDPSTNANWGSVYEFENSGQQISWPYFPLR